MGSINSVSPAGRLPPGDCLLRYNLIPAEYGLRVRLGSREWVTGLDGEPYTLLPFTGSASGGAANKLFACTSTGIWDVTSSTAAPTQVVAFGVVDTTSGWGTSVVFVRAAGAGHFLLYCDESNGYFVYDEVGGTWTQPTMGGGAGQVANVNPADLVFVTVWKNRVWFVERDCGSAWYLDLDSVYGAATEFNFGKDFKAGGDLRGLWSWTGTAGAGLDDALVAISGGGDVIVYQGTDPDTAGAFGIVGRWDIGAVPVGRRIAHPLGGDLLIMSSMGILRASTLDTSSSKPSQYETARISNLWNKKQISYRALRGWGMALHPEDATLIVIVPVQDGAETEQLAMGIEAKAWSQYRDLQMGVCAVPWDGTLYYGSIDGRVLKMTGYVDGITLADPSAYDTIQWALLTGFTDLGSPVQKRVQMLIPNLLSESPVSYVTRAKYKWDLTEIIDSPEAVSANGESLWDVATWDSGLWSGEYTPTQGVKGAAGVGREFAVAIRGESASRTVLTGIYVTFDTGGPL